MPDGYEYVKNPSGVVHDVESTHPSVELARKNESGWRLASAEEIREYSKANSLDAPAQKTRADDESKAKDDKK